MINTSDVYVVLETIEHDEHDCTDGTSIVGVYANKSDAISIVNARYENEREGRGIDGWTDHNGGCLYDCEDSCKVSWSIEPYVVY